MTTSISVTPLDSKSLVQASDNAGVAEHSLTVQAGLLFGGRGAAFLLTFLTPLVLVRTLSPHEFALYKQLFLIHGTFTAVLTLGLPASLLYFAPSYPHERGAYLMQTFLGLSVAGAVGGVVILLFNASLGQAVNNPSVSAFATYLAALVFLSLVTGPLEMIMLSFKDVRLATVTTFTSEFLRSALIIAAATWVGGVRVIMAATAAWGIARIVGLVAYVRRLGISPWVTSSRARVKRQALYAFPFALAVFVRVISDVLPQYGVSCMFDPVLFAVYSVGCLQIPLVAITSDSICDVALVRITQLCSTNRYDEAARVVASSVVKLSLVLFPLFVWLVLNARDLVVLLFTARFEASVGIFQVFMLTIPLTALALDYVPRAFADTGFVLRVNVVRALLTAGLLFLLIPRFGLRGAAVASVVALGCAKLLILRKVSRLFGTSLADLLPWSRIAKSFTMAAAAGGFALVVTSQISMPPSGRLAASAALCGLFYAVFSWFGGAIGPDEKHKVIGFVRSSWSRIRWVPSDGDRRDELRVRD